MPRLMFVIAWIAVAATVVATAAAINTRSAGPAGGGTVGCAEQALDSLAPVIRWHAQRYPELETEDLYKLLHQSVAGPAHAIEDPEMARRWMEAELAGLGAPRPGEAMFEPLSADGRLVRVNLRPWKAAGNPLEPVLDAFVRTADAIPPDVDRIGAQLDVIAGCAAQLSSDLRLDVAALRDFFAARAEEGYPAIHHSDRYSETYRPAYRVVLRDYLD